MHIRISEYVEYTSYITCTKKDAQERERKNSNYIMDNKYSINEISSNTTNYIKRGVMTQKLRFTPNNCCHLCTSLNYY